jgi:hypothetical protein
LADDPFFPALCSEKSSNDFSRSVPMRGKGLRFLRLQTGWLYLLTNNHVVQSGRTKSRDIVRRKGIGKRKLVGRDPTFDAC